MSSKRSSSSSSSEASKSRKSTIAMEEEKMMAAATTAATAITSSTHTPKRLTRAQAAAEEESVANAIYRSQASAKKEKRLRVKEEEEDEVAVGASQVVVKSDPQQPATKLSAAAESKKKQVATATSEGDSSVVMTATKPESKKQAKLKELSLNETKEEEATGEKEEASESLATVATAASNKSLFVPRHLRSGSASQEPITENRKRIRALPPADMSEKSAETDAEERAANATESDSNDAASAVSISHRSAIKDQPTEECKSAVPQGGSSTDSSGDHSSKSNIKHQAEAAAAAWPIPSLDWLRKNTDTDAVISRNEPTKKKSQSHRYTEGEKIEGK